MKRLAAIATVLAIFSAVPYVTAGEDPNRESDATDEIRSVSEALTRAFNKGDAEAVVKLWTADGDYVGPRGKLIQGKTNIRENFEKFFSLNPGVRLNVSITSIRLIGSDTAILDGVPEVTPPIEGPPTTFHSTIVLVRQDGQWRIASIRDMLFRSQSNYEQLKQLDWLIGDWVDASPESDDVSIRSSCQWTDNKNFLLRKFDVVLKDRITASGTQLIGWDSRNNRIRSWVFDTTGGFSEGEWHRDGNRWIIVTSGVQQSGREISTTNVLTRIDDDTFTVESRDRLIDGRPDADIEAIEIRRVVAEPKKRGGKTSPKRPARATILPD